MIALEVAGAVVLLALGLTVTWMAIVGLMGITGAVRLRRCRTCGHLVTTTRQIRSACPYCHHPWLGRHVVHMRLHHFLPGEWEPKF
jgi:DNA-directed RNA polymerase subunit RPC12/RpoP